MFTSSLEEVEDSEEEEGVKESEAAERGRVKTKELTSLEAEVVPQTPPLLGFPEAVALLRAE